MKFLAKIFIIMSGLAVTAAHADGSDFDSHNTKVTFGKSLSGSGNLILGVYADGQLGEMGQSINKMSNQGISHAIKATGFSGEFGKTQTITGPQNSGYQQIILVGLGEKNESQSDIKWRKLGGDMAQKAVKEFKAAPDMALDLANAEAEAQFALGAKLGSYYFDKYKTNEDSVKRQDMISMVSSNADDANAFYTKQLEPLADAISKVRNASNEPANVMYPESFVERWKGHFDGLDNLSIKVIDEKQMQAMNMGAIYGVGRGSKRPPRMMIVEYTGGKSGERPVVVVGKGITFDTGGISLKNPPNMWNMKFDMSGAASAMGTVYALAANGAKVNVVGVAALAENMPGGNAQRPGDVVTSMSGKTIQIRSTDAEGRLVLADGNYYADTKYDPALMVNLATLTGSASRALGKDYAAMFTRHDELTDKFVEMGKQTGDEVWPMPLNDSHFEAIKNNVADIMNSGPDAPGASAGAAFLGTFVRESTPWVHLDIAGVAYSDSAMSLKSSPGSRSFGVALLYRYIKTHFENK